MKNNKKHLLVFLIIISPVLFFAIKWGIEKYTTKKRGVYVIGKLVKETKPGFHTGHGKYLYFYLGKSYIISMGSYSLDSFVFVNVSSSDPSKAFIVLDTKVPDCVLPKDVPKEGWSELPHDTCK